MSNLHDLAGHLRSREAGLVEEYKALVENTSFDAEKKLASQLADFQRFQTIGLELLAEGVPDQFFGFGRITSDDVNLREGPGARYDLVSKLSQGELVIIRGFSSLWVEVQVPRGPSGYVFKDYLQQETK